MEKKELKERLEKIKENIKSNSKDSLWSEKMLAEYKSVLGQLNHEPTLAHVPLKDIEKKLDGDEFEAAIMKDGSCVYRMRGGYTLIAPVGAASLCGAIRNIVESQEIEKELKDEDDAEAFKFGLTADTLCLGIPFFVFGDIELKYSIVDILIKYFERMENEVINNAELKEETEQDVIENEEFREAAIALENIKEQMGKES